MTSRNRFKGRWLALWATIVALVGCEGRVSFGVDSRPRATVLADGLRAIDDVDAGVRCYVANAGATVGGVAVHCLKVSP